MIIVSLLIALVEAMTLALFWRKPFDCCLTIFSQKFINMEVHYPHKHVMHLTGFMDFLKEIVGRILGIFYGLFLMTLIFLGVSWEILMIFYQMETKRGWLIIIFDSRFSDKASRMQTLLILLLGRIPTLGGEVLTF